MKFGYLISQGFPTFPSFFVPSYPLPINLSVDKDSQKRAPKNLSSSGGQNSLKDNENQ